MLRKQEAQPEYLEDWPKHYHEIKDIDQREACLNEILRQHPDSADDLLRKDLFQRRFGERAEKKPIDKFMRGWMMIRISDKEKLSFINKKHQEKELRRNLAELCVLDCPENPFLEEEYQDFARTWIHTCVDSSSYKSTMFGMVQASDRNIAFRMANEIDAVTRTVPAQFGLEDSCRTLRTVMVREFISSIENGEQYWNDYCMSLK